MKKQFSAAEKWLFAAPLVLLGVCSALLFLRKATKPDFLATPLPAIDAHFLPGRKMLVVMQPALTGVQTFPTAAIFDWPSGKESKSLPIFDQISTFESQVSPNRKYWLVRQTSANYKNEKMVLRSLPSLQTIEVFNVPKGSGVSQVYDPDDREAESWSVGNNGHVSRGKKDPKNEGDLSPDGKWTVKYWSGKETTLDFNNANGRGKRDYLPTSQTVVSAQNPSIRFKLPGKAWHSASWEPGSRRFQGVVCLTGIYPERADILSFDTAIHRVSAIQLEIPQHGMNLNFSENTFRFSPDHRFLALSHLLGSFLLWDAGTGKLLKYFRADDKSNFIMSEVPEFSPDSTRFLHLTPSGVEIYRLDKLLPR